MPVVRGCPLNNIFSVNLKKNVIYQMNFEQPMGRQLWRFPFGNKLRVLNFMWESRLKCGLLCKNKIVTIFLLVFYSLKTALT